MVETALLNWTLNQLLSLAIILTRVGPLLFFMPVLGSRGVPEQARALLALMISLVLLPVVRVDPSIISGPATSFVVLVVCEVIFAAILALFTRFVFAATETAGQIVGIQMGMGMAGVMDPQFGTQTSPIGMLWNLTAILVFLAIDGHHIFFSTLVESFTWVRPGTIHITKATFEGIMQGTAHMFILSIKIMAPASVALFFANVATGIIAKTVPQIPILVVGLPLNLAIGLVFAGLSLNLFLPLMITNFEMLGRLLPKLAMGMGG